MSDSQRESELKLYIVCSVSGMSEFPSHLQERCTRKLELDIHSDTTTLAQDAFHNGSDARSGLPDSPEVKLDQNLFRIPLGP